MTKDNKLHLPSVRYFVIVIFSREFVFKEEETKGIGSVVFSFFSMFRTSVVECYYDEIISASTLCQIGLPSFPPFQLVKKGWATISATPSRPLPRRSSGTDRSNCKRQNQDVRFVTSHLKSLKDQFKILEVRFRMSLVARTRLYNPLCLSVRRSVRQLVYGRWRAVFASPLLPARDFGSRVSGHAGRNGKQGRDFGVS